MELEGKGVRGGGRGTLFRPYLCSHDMHGIRRTLNLCKLRRRNILQSLSEREPGIDNTRVKVCGGVVFLSQAYCVSS